MNDVHYLAVVVAAAAVVVVSSVYYALFSKQMAQLSAAYADVETNARPPAWKMGLELVRSFVVALVVAGIASRLDIEDVSGGIGLGLALWIGFPVVLWTGAVAWEKVPPKLATIHAGDWLLKLLVIAIVVSIWQ